MWYRIFVFYYEATLLVLGCLRVCPIPECYKIIMFCKFDIGYQLGDYEICGESSTH